MTNLPPRPDPTTGEPRPPEAPTQHQGVPSETPPKTLPAPPEGEAPALEYHRLSKRNVWLGAPIPIVILLALAVLHSGFVALTYWFVWAIAAVYLAYLIYTVRSDVLTAGAEWVRLNRAWVKTYELTSMNYVGRGSGSSFAVVLKDRERSVELPLHIAQANKQLWDLVYLGMRYSAANGAEANRAMRSQFPDLAPSAPRQNNS